ncbi:kif1 [Symbiodinium sp. CCMP2592]|nr:kif1 [Symbiodinium sp. CCMP2592]
MAGTHGGSRAPASPAHGENPGAASGGRKRPATDDEGEEQPLTLNTLLAALKENREEIVAKVREDIDAINTRMTTVEVTVDTHVTNTTKLLEAMTDRHCVMEQSVRNVDERQKSVLERLELLEGKFAKANFSMSSTRTSETDGGNPRPALVVGGWNADQHHEETLQLVKQHLHDLNVNLDTSQAFVPGLRRGFALVPLNKLEGESDSEQRARVQEVLRTIRAAKIVTGQRPEGGHRYFFAALSQSPERRKKAQLAGKVKRLIIEEGGDVRKIDVEYGTANLWYNSVKVASGVTSAPDGASVEKAGWVHLGTVARQIGISEEAATSKWGELRKALQPSQTVHVISWNVGGLTSAKALEVILALRRHGIQPFCDSLIVFLQEIICEGGKYHAALDELQMVFGKRTEDWRGNAIMHTSNLRHTRGKLLPCSISCTLSSDTLRLGAFSIHIPHHATLSATEQILQELHAHLQSHGRAVIGIDANETFEPARQQRQVKACTARGELLLEWFEEEGCHFPEQQLHEPSHFPYNTAFEPRRLDYVLAKKLLFDSGKVLAQRDIATSDHEPISVPLTQIRIDEANKGEKAAPWSSRTLRPGAVVDAILDHQAKTGGDPVTQIQEVAVAISKPGKNKLPFKESDALRALRRQALHAVPGEDRRRLWKTARKMHQSEHRKWQQLAMQRVAELDWGMKKALVEQSRDHSWELKLTDSNQWKQELKDHFEKIFHRQKQVVVTAKIRGIMNKLEHKCKNTRWMPFILEDLYEIKVKWKNGRSCGPDRVSHEALKAMLPHPIWGNRLLALFNDMLYTCRIVESIEAGATILLAKTTQPQDWSERRPITLSSVLLKTFGQLLLQRAGEAIQAPARLQWCRRGRQGIELILILRRLARVARDWGLEFYIAKLDIRKAFDSIFQESLAEHVCQAVGEDANLSPGKASRSNKATGSDKEHQKALWLSAPSLPKTLMLPSGKQRAPNRRPTQPPPEDGGSYMDDNYIWSTFKKHFQHMLTALGDKLPGRGLYLHPGKTDIISTGEKEVHFQVAGERVATKGPKHVFHVLGSPLSFQGGTAMLLAEAQSRARKAFWAPRLLHLGGYYPAKAANSRRTRATECTMGLPDMALP